MKDEEYIQMSDIYTTQYNEGLLHYIKSDSYKNKYRTTDYHFYITKSKLFSVCNYIFFKAVECLNKISIKLNKSSNVKIKNDLV